MSANPYKNTQIVYYPFSDSEQAWFWFINSYDHAGLGICSRAAMEWQEKGLPRPCEPLDILRLVDRLLCLRRLSDSHIKILYYYGLLGYAPQESDYSAYSLWSYAMTELSYPLRDKKIIV